MKRYLIIITFIIIAICSTQIALTKPKVAVTIFPLYDIVRNIAGKSIDVKLIVPPLASPHTFEFTPHEIAELQGTKAIFCIGHNLDNWVLKVRYAYGEKIPIITMDKGIKLIKNNGVENPHYWLSPLNAIKMADYINLSLAKLFPSRKGSFKRNTSNYKGILLSLNERTSKLLKPLRGKMLLTYHRAYDYFAQAYSLRILGSFQPPGGKSPTPYYLKKLTEKIKEYHVNAFFVEPQIPIERVKPFISDLALQIYYLDPLGGVKGRESYAALIRFNRNSILKAFK